MTHIDKDLVMAVLDRSIDTLWDSFLAFCKGKGYLTIDTKHAVKLWYEFINRLAQGTPDEV